MSQTVHDLPLPASSALSAFVRTPINWLLIFVPITLVLERFEGAPAPLVFFSAGIAIVPVAAAAPIPLAAPSPSPALRSPWCRCFDTSS